MSCTDCINYNKPSCPYCFVVFDDEVCECFKEDDDGH